MNEVSRSEPSFYLAEYVKLPHVPIDSVHGAKLNFNSGSPIVYILSEIDTVVITAVPHRF